MRKPNVESSDVLEKLSPSKLQAGIYYHVYEAAWGWRATHPYSKARLALVEGRPDGTVVRNAYYLANSANAAIWEVVLRDAAPDPWGGVWVQPGQIMNRRLATIRLKRDIDIVRMDKPHRRHSVTVDSTLDKNWDRWLTTTEYVATHHAASRADRQFSEGSLVLPGFQWCSRQLQTGLVCVLYGEELDDAWELVDDIALQSESGIEAIRVALEAGGMKLVGDPTGSDFDPPSSSY